MVFKNIDRIKTALPEVLHVVMFYNNGTVFQTTFTKEINVPKLGENLTEFIHHIKNVYEICNFKLNDFKKIIFETNDVSVIILKLGEESNIALFFKEDDFEGLKLSSIKRYLTRIEELIDMDEKEIYLQEILVKEDELKSNQHLLQLKQDEIQNLLNELKELDQGEFQEKSKMLGREINSLEEECAEIEKEIDNINEEILKLKEIIANN
jgi:hypothetical protein